MSGKTLLLVFFSFLCTTTACRHHTCPAYASADLKYKKRKKPKQKKWDSRKNGLFTAEQNRIAKAGKKEARKAKRVLKKKKDK